MSMPMPRPLVVLTSSRVDSPGVVTQGQQLVVAAGRLAGRPGGPGPRPSMPRPSSSMAISQLVVAALVAGDADAALFRLAQAAPLLRMLEAMVHRVADEVHNRREDAFAHRLVQLGPAGVELEPHPLADVGGQPPHQQGDPFEQLGGGDHPGLHDRGAQVANLAAVLLDDACAAPGRRRPGAASSATARSRRKRVTTRADSFSSASSRRATSTRTTLCAPPAGRSSGPRAARVPRLWLPGGRPAAVAGAAGRPRPDRRGWSPRPAAQPAAAASSPSAAPVTSSRAKASPPGSGRRSRAAAGARP